MREKGKGKAGRGKGKKKRKEKGQEGRIFEESIASFWHTSDWISCLSSSPLISSACEMIIIALRSEKTMRKAEESGEKGCMMGNG